MVIGSKQKFSGVTIANGTTTAVATVRDMQGATGLLVRWWSELGGVVGTAQVTLMTVQPPKPDGTYGASTSWDATTAALTITNQIATTLGVPPATAQVIPISLIKGNTTFTTATSNFQGVHWPFDSGSLVFTAGAGTSSTTVKVEVWPVYGLANSQDQGMKDFTTF